MKECKQSCSEECEARCTLIPHSRRIMYAEHRKSDIIPWREYIQLQSEQKALVKNTWCRLGGSNNIHSAVKIRPTHLKCNTNKTNMIPQVQCASTSLAWNVCELQLRRPALPVIGLSQLSPPRRPAVPPDHVTVSSVLVFSSPPFLFLVPLQCTQGTKGLLESAAIPPLLSTSCPQGKPHSAHTGPTVNSDPSPELSASCGVRQAAAAAAGSRGVDTSPPRRTKTRSKKSKRAPLDIDNLSFDGPVSPTSPDAGPRSKAGGHKGARFASWHWLKREPSEKHTHCLKLACGNTDTSGMSSKTCIICWSSESSGSGHRGWGWQSLRYVFVCSVRRGCSNTRADWMYKRSLWCPRKSTRKEEMLKMA